MLAGSIEILQRHVGDLTNGKKKIYQCEVKMLNKKQILSSAIHGKAEY